MKVVRCSNGHFYDEERYAQCPRCKEADRERDYGIPSKYARLGKVQKTGQDSAGFVYRISGEKEYILKEIVCKEDEDRYQNVLYEIAVMQKLSGAEQVIQLYDCEEKAEGNSKTVYLLEEYLMPFSEFLDKQVLTAGGVIKMVMELCSGLIACREAGILQLDVQPKTLSADVNGSIKIGDFGCALFMPDLKDSRPVRGALAYMAPEVYRKGRCSERSDIYSVGILLYYLFNERRLPFLESGNEETAVYKRLAGTPLPETAYRDERLLPKLRQVIEGACAYEAEERIQTFEELKGELQLLYQEAQRSGAGSQNLYRDRPVTPAPVPVVPKKAERPVFCLCCGARLPRGGAFCVNCGAGVDFGSAKDLTRSYIPSPAMSPAMPSPAMPQAMPSAAPNTAGGRVDLKKVQFSAIAPKAFVKGDYTMIEIVMYEEAFRKVVDELISEAEEPVKETKSGIFKVAEGSSVRIVLSSPDIEIEDGEEEQEWQGGYLNFSFAVMLPEQYKKRQILFTAAVFINDVIATKLKFIVKCFSLFEQKVKVSREDILSAFISYASQDRHRVAAIIQGMKKARPEMDIFFDVESLRSGEDWEKALRCEIEKRDILFLFWSQSARESKWVDVEWRYAMENKGVDCIEPVPIDPPGVCPPPEELSKKHFNDKLLYIINENGSKENGL